MGCKMKILQLGCGMKKIKGAITVDITPVVKPDIVHDLNKFSYPFENNKFDLIICDDIIEHLDNIIEVVEELYRISKPNALIKITVPHFSSDDSFADLTHKHLFSIRSFDVFDEARSNFPFYTKARFKITKTRIDFGRLGRLCSIAFLANKFPLFYESHLAFIFQAHKIYLELRAVK